MKKNIAVFCVLLYEDEILLGKRNYGNYGRTLPGGSVEENEGIIKAIKREAKEETSIDVRLEKLFNVYSDPDRDPRRHTVSVCYLAHGNFDEAKADDDAKDIGVFSFDDLDEDSDDALKIAFDHRKILNEIKEYLEND